LIFRDEQKSEKIINSLNLKISARESRSAKTDPKAFLRAVCSQWIPLSQAVLCIFFISIYLEGMLF